MTKIQLNVLMHNSESKSEMEDEFVYESLNHELQKDLDDLAKSDGTMNIVKYLHKIIRPGTEIYKHYLDVFTRVCHDKAGWFAAEIHIKSVVIDGKLKLIHHNELEDTDMIYLNRLSLMRTSICNKCSHIEDRRMAFMEDFPN